VTTRELRSKIVAECNTRAITRATSHIHLLIVGVSKGSGGRGIRFRELEREELLANSPASFGCFHSRDKLQHTAPRFGSRKAIEIEIDNKIDRRARANQATTFAVFEAALGEPR